MAITEVVERKFRGHAENGQAIYSVACTGRYQPESMADWLLMRQRAMGSFARDPAGQVTLHLYSAGSPHEMKAAVARGGGLDAWGRYAVLRCLEAGRDASQDFPAGLAAAEEAVRAWRARWGDEPPQDR